MYGTVGDADTYHAARGNAAWAAADAADRAAALVRGSLYLDGAYPLWRLPGLPAVAGQEHHWPRTDATDYWGNDVSGTVPTRVEHAAYEAALVEMTSPGSLTPTYTESARVRREKVGPIETEYADSAMGIHGSIPVLATVHALMAPLLLPERAYPSLMVV